MANNVAASMKASIVIDKKELISSALSAYAEAQKELDGNKIELLVDVSDDKALKKLKEIQKELTGKEYILKFKNQGTDEILESLDVLEKRLKDIFSGKAFGTGTGKGIGNSIVDEKSLQSVLYLFTKMESHLGDMKRVFADVGDGGEFSPLLSTIEKINASITELSKSVKGIGLNMNIDFGSDKELEAKAEAKISNALQAYQRLFDHIKMSGVGGSIITQKFFDFDIDQFDGMMGKLNAYKKFIENMRIEAKGQFNGNDVLYQETDKKYWTSVSSAMGQVTKAFNEMKASGDTNPLEKIFGGSKDLSEVTTQLSLITDKLDEISKSASEFKSVFKEGFNVSSSVEEIEKLTNRVKELEEELSKVKLSHTTSPVETNISSGNTTSSSEVKGNEEIANAIRKKKEELASYELKIEELRYEIEKLSKTESEAYGVKKAYSNMSDKYIDSVKERIYKTMFGTNASLGEGLRKYTTMDFGGNVEKGYIAWREELERLGYTLSELRHTELGVEADIIPIDGRAITNAEEFRKLLFDITSVSNDNIVALNSQITELESKISSIKAEIKSLESTSSTSIKDTFQGEKVEQTTTSAKELDKVLEEAFDVPVDSFDDVIKKFNIIEDKAENIAKIIKSSVQNADGKYDVSYNVKYKDGSNEIFGESSNPKKLRSNDILFDETEAQKESKKIIEENIRLNKAYYDAKEKEEREYQQNRKKFLAEGIKQEQNYYKEQKKTLSSFESSLSGLKGKFSDLSMRPDEEHRLPEFEKQLHNISVALNEYDTYVASLKEKSFVNEEDINKGKQLQEVVENLMKTASKTPVSERGFEDISASKIAEQIYGQLQANSNMSKQAKKRILEYYNIVRTGTSTRPLKEIYNEVLNIVQAERAAGREGKSFFSIFKEKVLYGAAGNLAGMIGIYDVINLFKQASNAVIELNTNITELAKVSEATSSQTYDDFNSYAEIAKEVGGTISDTIAATSDWARNGYNIPQSKELAEAAMIYKNVGDGINIEQANEYLISTLRGFNLEAESAMDIIDSMNEVANREPISASGIGEALQRSAAAFNAANTSLEESIALVTSTNSVLQSPEKVGSMWTTVSARIRGAKTELEEAGLETDGMVESTSKLQSLIKGMTGFDILESDGKTFKSIYDIIIGIGEEFSKLDDIDQAALLEALAGKRQSNALAATLNNIDILKKSYKEATNAEGSAMEEQRKYQESVQYSIDRTKASLEELANDFLSSDFLKGLIDSGDKLINILDWIIDKFGVLGTLAGGAGIFAGAKNFGKRRISVRISNRYCFEYALHA